MQEAKMREIAREIYAAHGVGDAPEQLAGGWTNSVWQAGGMVLRLTADREGGRLRRELQLARLLPESVGYPHIMDVGVTAECDWSLCEKVPGVNLEEAWPQLHWQLRAHALEQLWMRARGVHEVEIEAARPYVNAQPWYLSEGVDGALADAEALAARGIYSPGQLAAMRDCIGRFARALDSAPIVLAHGDLTAANAMWHAGNVVSLMDFECALLAPMEADLVLLLATAFDPEVGKDAEADATGRALFEHRMRELVQAARPDWDLLRGYELLRRQRHILLWLNNDPDFSPEWEPYREVEALLADGRGYFRAVMP